ncbi:MAG: serine protease [Thermoflexales bacterium]|nr:serine protease [Thermoflexales bacterium]
MMRNTMAAAAPWLATAQRSVVQVRVGMRGIGAGVVWRCDGDLALVVTNAHVVGSAMPRSIEIAFASGEVFRAVHVARHPSLDLAAVRVFAPSAAFIPATLGDSDRVRVGEIIFAIGHPFGDANAVTAGVISRIAEERGGALRRAHVLFSDVRLAPGNSGGPWINAKGEVIGISTLVLGGDLSAAIPINLVRAWLQGA